MTPRAYINEFVDHVNVLLGGLDMANEFFTLHRDLLDKLRPTALYHLNKGGAPDQAAGIFFRFSITPRIKADRAQACKLWREVNDPRK